MNAQEKLANEVERVTELRAQYEATQRLAPQANCRPAILMMTDSIERAKKALGSDDIIQTIDCLKDLEGYTS